MAHTYDHIRDRIEAHYRGRGDTVEVDPPGRGAPDILGARADGQALVGEIKSATEANGASSSWWSYWTKPERDLRPHYRQEPPTSPSALRGWCAVVDGQLREYCSRHSVRMGDLVVEDGTRYRGDIEAALVFLKSETRVLSWQHSADGQIDYWIIQYAAWV